MEQAIKSLHGVSEGDEAGQVFHEFASFCDQQLQNPDGIEDINRIERLRERKEAEVRELDKMIKSAPSQTKEWDTLKSHRTKAKSWFDLDDKEFRRLRGNRQAFLRQSLENYLLCLKACDQYDNDVLRFSALWLEHADSEIANEAVKKQIKQVSSRKFAPLINQWTSRLTDVGTPFAKELSALVLRVCLDHPFHGMYQVFAGSKSKGGKDDASMSHHHAATNIANSLKANKHMGQTWLDVHNTNISYVRFAEEKLDGVKPGSKVALREIAPGQKLEHDMLNKLPPPTMKIELRADCNYLSVPRVARFQPEFSVAGGISAPKILTVVTTDGKKHRQLVSHLPTFSIVC